ncbi:hypothetical protein GPECTOR_9g605 [Gonium pectorale]|uniref:Uncharacterized protein n=1 Tax=Gonium pectorale TaxID=33097 RepID=A0A150GRY8_GONPE|nr:hypothetical protein GPECTOR_9g605 [Gonium pectorale]|eukprot:KXZ52561.1 hypothetical protein GPECTOR_9g605 [Gonium pectorale]
MVGWQRHSDEDGSEDARPPQRQRSSSALTTDDGLTISDTSDNGTAKPRHALSWAQATALQAQEFSVAEGFAAAITVATRASALRPAAGSEVAPSSQDQPYSALLSGPAFSYGADEHGVFDTDVISFGSVGGDDDDDCVGSFMVEEESEAEWEREAPRRFVLSFATANSSSGGRMRDAHAALAGGGGALPHSAAAAAAAAAPPTGISPGVGSSAVSSGASNAGVPVAAVASMFGADAGAAKSNGAAPAQDGPTERESVQDVTALPPRAGSNESIASADAAADPFADPVANSGADAPDLAAAAAYHGFGAPAGSVAAHPSAADVYHGFAAAVAALGFASLPVQPVAAAAHHNAVAAMAAGVEDGEEASDAVAPVGPAPLPMAPLPPPPALLPPEVYLGFVSQLVASVQTATNVTSNYLQGHWAEGQGQGGPVAAAAQPPMFCPPTAQEARRKA